MNDQVKMYRPGEVLRRRDIFESTLQSLKCEDKEEESVRQKSGLGKGPDWQVRKM